MTRPPLKPILPRSGETRGDYLRRVADERGMPLRTLEQVKDGLAKAKKNRADVTLARLMLNHGRMTDEARAYVEGYGK